VPESQPAAEPEPAPAPVSAPAIDPSWKTHTDRRSKISFRYPSDYLFNQTRSRRDESAIVLMEDDKVARDYVSGKLKAPMDSPLQITIWLRKAELEDGTLEAFARNEAKSEAPLEVVEVAGKKAFAFKTDGLWQGRTVVVEGPGVVIQAHVDFNTPEDRIRKDFDAILSSLTW
jgi:hypothetical protein